MSQLSYLLLVERLRRLADNKQQTAIYDQEQLSAWLTSYHSSLTMVVAKLKELAHVGSLPVPSPMIESTLEFSSVHQSPIQVWNEYQREFQMRNGWLQYGWSQAVVDQKSTNWKQIEKEWWNMDWQRFLYRQFQEISLGYQANSVQREQEKNVTVQDLLHLVAHLHPQHGLLLVEQAWTDDLRTVLVQLYATLLRASDTAFGRGQILRRRQCQHLQIYNSVFNTDQRDLLIHQSILTTSTCAEALELKLESKELVTQLSIWNEFFTQIRSERQNLRSDEIHVYSPELEHLLWKIMMLATLPNGSQVVQPFLKQVPDFVINTYRWKWVEDLWKRMGQRLPGLNANLAIQAREMEGTVESMVGYLETLAEFLSLGGPGQGK